MSHSESTAKSMVLSKRIYLENVCILIIPKSLIRLSEMLLIILCLRQTFCCTQIYFSNSSLSNMRCTLILPVYLNPLFSVSATMSHLLNPDYLFYFFWSDSGFPRGLGVVTVHANCVNHRCVCWSWAKWFLLRLVCVDLAWDFIISKSYIES